MSLSPGTRLGPYEVVSSLGAGGMGEVYRANDSRLDRSVAVKVLPPALSQDPQFRARFEREAKTISQLNHPNICQIYDVGETSSDARSGAGSRETVSFLIMELLEGETLADRLDRGPLPLAEVLRYGRQIAGALAAAHNAGIVHRDLKPANIMLTKSGAKLLDFGLAKKTAGVLASDPNALTVARGNEQRPLTQEGTILGTFAYMAPEQLEGDEADSRTDIFALGNVLYEMLTGRRAFEGKTKTSLIAAIVDREPAPISAVQPLTPPALEHVVQKCLEKDPDARWQSARDVATELDWIERSPAVAAYGEGAKRSRPMRTLIAALMLLLLIAVAALAWSLSRETPQGRKLHAAIPPPSAAGFDFDGDGAGSLTLSPDGRFLTFSVPDSGGVSRLWLRELGSASARQLDGTERAMYPFWSPDSKMIGYFADGKLRTISISGGPSIEICTVQEPRGGSWSSDGTIIMAPHWREGIWKVSAQGGTPARVTQLREANKETTHRWPQFLPDGKHFIYLAGTHLSGPASADNGLYVSPLEGGEPKLIVRARSNAIYVDGYLLYLRDRYLVKHRFDADRLELEGEPVAIAEGVRNEIGYFRGVFAATKDLLVYHQGGSVTSSIVQWYDRTGAKVKTTGEPTELYAVILSRHEKLLAIGASDPSDIWIHDLQRDVKSRVTSHPLNDEPFAWGADNSTIYYNSDRDVYWDVYRRRAGGAEETLVSDSGQDFGTDVSLDEKFLLFNRGIAGAVSNDIHVFEIGSGGASRPYIATEFHEFEARFSPDQRWVAYTSNESGDMEVYISSFPDPSLKYQVSADGGLGPRWSADGRELFYFRPDRTLMSVPLTLQPSISIGKASALFQTNVKMLPEPLYDVTDDGRQFVVNDFLRSADLQPLTLVLPWSDDPRR